MSQHIKWTFVAVRKIPKIQVKYNHKVTKSISTFCLSVPQHPVNLYSNQLLTYFKVYTCKVHVVRMASLIRLRIMINFLIHLCISSRPRVRRACQQIATSYIYCVTAYRKRQSINFSICLSIRPSTWFYMNVNVRGHDGYRKLTSILDHVNFQGT